MECRLLPGFDYHVLFSAPTTKRMSGIAQAMEFILAQENGKKRYLPFVDGLCPDNAPRRGAGHP